jgi:calcineurin-like phosphoesterase family protein
MRFNNRPWNDVREMDKALVANWNSVVSDNDIVFILGDIFWKGDQRAIAETMKGLNGAAIYIILGNHDCKEYFNMALKDKRIQMLSDNVIVWISGIDENKPSREYEFMLSHCPLATWPHWQRGAVNLFGHIHSGPRSMADIDRPGVDLILKPGRAYDVGVDNNNYTPVEINEILNKLRNQ